MVGSMRASPAHAGVQAQCSRALAALTWYDEEAKLEARSVRAVSRIPAIRPQVGTRRAAPPRGPPHAVGRHGGVPRSAREPPGGFGASARAPRFPRSRPMQRHWSQEAARFPDPTAQEVQKWAGKALEKFSNAIIDDMFMGRVPRPLAASCPPLQEARACGRATAQPPQDAGRPCIRRLIRHKPCSRRHIAAATSRDGVHVWLCDAKRQSLARVEVAPARRRAQSEPRRATAALTAAAQSYTLPRLFSCFRRETLSQRRRPRQACNQWVIFTCERSARLAQSARVSA